MRIDCKDYSGPCECGKTHGIETVLCEIESGVLANIEEYMATVGLRGAACAVYDTNTYNIPGLKRPKAHEIVLDATNLHANEKAVETVLAKIPAGTEVLISVGSGTVTDVTRYCAYKLSIPFVACPTAASCDGFCSNVAAMTFGGYKVTLPARPPKLVLADLGIISKAPWFLTLSGIGDILGKYTALADWRISQILTGEEVCEKIYGVTASALRDAVAGCATIQSGSKKAYEDLTYSLLMSGLAIQMLGTSRPASGAEHHVSHFIEVEPPSLELEYQALHGEKVGVGVVLASEEYHRLAETEDISSTVLPYAPASGNFIMKAYGPAISESCKKTNEHDCLRAVTPEKLAEKWPEVRKVIAEIPSADELEGLLIKLGAKHTLRDIGVLSDSKELILDASPLIRNRLTLMRIRRMLLKDTKNRVSG